MRAELIRTIWLADTAAILLGFVLDLLFGDPIGRFHPVCIIGELISVLEKRLNRKESRARGNIARGFLLVCMVLITTAVVTGILLGAASCLPLWGYLLISALLCDTTLAVKDLRKESMAVADVIEDLPAARKAVSRIVGRDTESLTKDGVLRAAVETVAENTTDGVVAPLFYLMLGGPLLAMLYKAVNTMDSMIGYKNVRYLYFGRCAARLDDLLNFLPARIAAILWIAAAGFCGMDGKGAYRIWRRDRYNHESPNSAQTESACAGSLGIQLAGAAYYFGIKKEKPVIGDALRSIEKEDIARTNWMMLITALLALLVGIAFRAGIYLLIVYLFRTFR